MYMSWLRLFVTDEEGLIGVEYALLLFALVVGLTVTWQSLGDPMVNIVDETNQTLAPGQQAGLGCQ